MPATSCIQRVCSDTEPAVAVLDVLKAFLLSKIKTQPRIGFCGARPPGNGAVVCFGRWSEIIAPRQSRMPEFVSVRLFACRPRRPPMP
jgi:hypothetical protein